MYIAEKVAIAVGIMCLIAMVVLIPVVSKKQSDFEVACKEAGGIAYTSTKSYNLCLNPTAIVELK